MKENIHQGTIKEDFSKAEISEGILKHSIVAILGYISAKASVKGLMLPFGLAFLGGIVKPFYASAAIGVFSGYFLTAFSGNGFRYIAALFAILAIKLITSQYVKISENPIFAGFITLLSSTITNTLTLTGAPADTLAFLCEGFLSAAGAYFICVSSKALTRNELGLSANEMASLLITVSIFLMGLERISVYGISVGKTAGILLILIASKYGGTLSGAVSGIAVSFACALTGNYNNSFFSYSLGGMTAGIFAPLGKYAQGASVIICYLTDSSLSGFKGSFFKGFAEVIIGSVLFLFIPQSLGTYISKLFSLSPKISENSGVKKAMNIRLTMAADALREISKTTEKVSKELRKINVPDFGHILFKIEEDSCRGCKNRSLCWEERRNATVNSVSEIIKSVKGIESENKEIPNDLKGRCIRYGKLYESVVKRYTEYSSFIAGEHRIEEVRNVVCNQFLGISEMLYELGKDFETEEAFNSPVSLNIASVLKNLELNATETSAFTDKFGRTTATVKIKKSPELVINKRKIMKFCSAACELDFDAPTVTDSGNFIYLTLSEHASYKIDVGIEQSPSKENVISGDAFSCFNDGKGHYIMILSDGMGTGGRAAVDGAMASGLMAQLIKAGFNYNCALKLLNSSMLFKSSDESLATLDIVSIDLYTGDVKFYKAGAAPTLVKRSGSCGVAQSNSLPVGILENVSFDTAKIRLKANDIILLLSDGATCEGTDWIKSELECFKDGSAQALAEHICNCAKRRISPSLSDDVTVMAAIIKKAN